MHKPVGSSRLPPRSFSRRAFLRGVLAMGAVARASSILGCRTVPFTQEQIQDLQLFEKLSRQPPLITELRLGHSIKKRLEELAEKNPDEIVLAKEQPGRVRNVTIRSTNQDAQTIFSRTTRSLIHTHPQEKWETEIDYKLSSVPSVRDIRSFLQKSSSSKKNSKLKYYHIAVMNYQNKVIGYYSLGLSKKLSEIMNPPFFGLFSSEHQKFQHVLKQMDEVERQFHRLQTPEASNEYYQQYQYLVEELHKLGLLIRRTSMRGYEFKDGYFQPKLLKKV